MEHAVAVDRGAWKRALTESAAKALLSYVADVPRGMREGVPAWQMKASARDAEVCQELRLRERVEAKVVNARGSGRQDPSGKRGGLARLFVARISKKAPQFPAMPF